MAMAEQALHLGIDWGTHSSKWACRVGEEGKYMPHFPLYSSSLLRVGEELTFSPEDEAEDEDSIVRSLKGRLIEDPLGQPFWGSEPRMDTGTSLGEAVAFSLCSLLSDAKRRISEEIDSITTTKLSIGFSFPNWVVDSGKRYRVAARNFTEAALVAMDLHAHLAVSRLPTPGKAFPIDEWRAIVSDSRQRLGAAQRQELDVESITQSSFNVEGGEGIWSFLMESGAAGLPYLRAMDVEVVPGCPGLAKLLVIDVGAGSTDVGYMLRVKNRNTGEEKFYYFRPASSFPEAGNVLTEEIMKHHAHRNQPLTYREAEARKLQRSDWCNLPFVGAWIRRICAHIQTYLEGVPDERWLPMPVSLEVVITGGSGLVPGLSDAIGEAIREALESRRYGGAVKKVNLTSRHLPQLTFRTEAEYARRAVCLGAADTNKPGFRYMEKMGPPAPPVRPKLVPKWV